MATQGEIKRNISNTRSHISYVVDEISNTIHNKVDWQQKVKNNPGGALLVAVAAGFAIATIASPISKPLLRFGMRSAFAALGAYASKQGVNYITRKIKT